ncbi:MAG: 30S ribosomal protein S20 [Deltaproteobacteria bacterium]|nr:30S ribosomal protein S20 [Deltaproteobacteria bacterium]
MASPAKKPKLPSGRHASQIKRQRQNEKRAERNRLIRSDARTFIKAVRAAVANQNLESAQNALKIAVKKIDKAVSKGIFHANKGARNISRLTKLVSSLVK